MNTTEYLQVARRAATQFHKGASIEDSLSIMFGNIVDSEFIERDSIHLDIHFINNLHGPDDLGMVKRMLTIFYWSIETYAEFDAILHGPYLLITIDHTVQP